MPCLTGTDITSYFGGKKKVLHLKTFLDDYYPGPSNAFNETGVTHIDVMAAGKSFICALLGIPPATPMAEAWHQIYTCKLGKRYGFAPNKAEALSAYPAKSLCCNPHANRYRSIHLALYLFNWDMKDTCNCYFPCSVAQGYAYSTLKQYRDRCLYYANL